MNVESIHPEQLTTEQRERWDAWRRATPALQSPLFAAQLVRAVSDVRNDVRIAVIRDGQGEAAFYPYRTMNGVAHPYLDCLHGFDAVIARPNFTPTAELTPLLLQSIRLRGWRLRSSLVEQPCFAAYQSAEDDYPYIDLANGFEAYKQERRAAKSDELTTALRKTRKIEREIGPLRFRAASDSQEDLDTLLRWKAEQLQERRLVNHLQQPWVRSLFDNLLSGPRCEQLAPLFSTLRLDGQLLAASFAVRSESVLHGWVMAFNGRFYKYSPGSLLLAQILQAAEGLGIARIDMGRGSEGYKQSFRSGGFAVGDGLIESRPLRRVAGKMVDATKRFVASTPLAGVARGTLQRLRWLLQSSVDSS